VSRHFRTNVRSEFVHDCETVAVVVRSVVAVVGDAAVVVVGDVGVNDDHHSAVFLPSPVDDFARNPSLRLTAKHFFCSCHKDIKSLRESVVH